MPMPAIVQSIYAAAHGGESPPESFVAAFLESQLGFATEVLLPQAPLSTNNWSTRLHEF